MGYDGGSYAELKEKLNQSLRNFGNEENILKLHVQRLTKAIDSPRQQSRIKTFRDLIQQLEHRNHFSSNDVTILKLWAEAIKWSDGRAILEQYEKLNKFRSSLTCDTCQIQLNIDLDLPKDGAKSLLSSDANKIPDLVPLVKTEPSNGEKEKNESKTPSKQASSKKIDDESATQSKITDVDEAFDSVAGLLGRCWKDFARKVKLNVYDIEEIDDHFKWSYKDKAFEVLKLWKERNGDEVTTIKLKEVFLLCNRKDLVHTLDKLGY